VSFGKLLPRLRGWAGAAGDGGAWSATTRCLQLLIVAVVIIPIALFGTASWLNYLSAFRYARDQVARATDAIDEQAQKAFETDELILDRVAERVAGMDWSQIDNSNELHELLAHLAAQAGVAAVGVLAPDHTIAASSRVFPAPHVTASARSYLRVDRAGGAPIYVGSVAPSAYSGEPQFTVARPIPSATSLDGGLIYVSMPLSGFTDYYRSVIASDQYLVTLARADGDVLVRYPTEEPAGRVLGSQSPFRQMLAKSAERGTYDAASELDGIVRLFAYRKVPGYPVYVSVGLARSAVIDGWLRLMASHLIFGIPATLCLVALTWFAWRRSIAADRALAAARSEAERRRIAEESLRQAQKTEAIGQMTGGVAHDFNNLLTAVTGNLDMILRRPEDGARVRRLAEAALRATMRGERLTQQLLMFSRRQVMRPETLNLNRLLLEFEGLMRQAVGERIELQLRVDPGLDPSHVDRAQFEAAILNLAVNARDAMPGGGRITIETHNVVLDADYAAAEADVMPGSYVMTAVSDTGSGIAKEALPHVFEPFFTTKDVGKGSGLGLSQVYGFAKESAGHVKIYSEPGLGTSVKLYLPKSADRPVAVARPGLSSLHPADSGDTVLVVEDDESVLATAVESLGDLGYRVLVAHNGPEALRVINGPEPIDILFSDIVMPGGINGAQLATEARRLRPSLKVLLTSGYSGAALAEQHDLPDDLPVLGKPYRRDELAAQLRVLAGGEGC
jgi:signal transduction histidine kinase/CheY-like chemotaxis protein